MYQFQCMYNVHVINNQFSIAFPYSEHFLIPHGCLLYRDFTVIHDIYIYIYSNIIIFYYVFPVLYIICRWESHRSHRCRF